MASPTVPTFSGPTYEPDAADNILTLNRPTGATTGDVLLAVLVADNADTVEWSAPDGTWTAVFTNFDQNNNVQLHAWWKAAGGSEPSTYAFTKSTGSGTVMGGGILRISGADTSAPIDISGTNVGTGTTITCPSVVASVVDTLIVRIMGADDNDYTDNGSPSGHTVLWANDTASGLQVTSGAAHQAQASAGASGTADFTGLGVSRDWCAATIAIKPAAGGVESRTVSIAGAGATSFVSKAEKESALSAAGLGALSPASKADKKATLAAAGAGAATFSGTAVLTRTFAIAGAAAVSLASKADKKSALAAAGAATPTLVAKAAVRVTLTAAGVAAGSFTSKALKKGTLVAAGTASADFIDATGAPPAPVVRRRQAGFVVNVGTLMGRR